MRSNICQTFVNWSQPIASTGLREATFIWEASFIKGSLWTILSAKFGDKTDRLLEHHLANKPFQPQTWRLTGKNDPEGWYILNVIDQNHKLFCLHELFFLSCKRFSSRFMLWIKINFFILVPGVDVASFTRSLKCSCLHWLMASSLAKCSTFKFTYKVMHAL